MPNVITYGLFINKRNIHFDSKKLVKNVLKGCVCDFEK